MKIKLSDVGLLDRVRRLDLCRETPPPEVLVFCNRIGVQVERSGRVDKPRYRTLVTLPR